MEKYKKVIQSNKFKISAQTNKKFKITDESYSVSDIQNYFEYIIKIHKRLTDNSPIRIYEYKIENRVEFKIQTGYYLELLSSETINYLEVLKVR